MKALIWLFFLVAILMVMRWYLNNRDATGAFDSTTGRFAMRDELERFIIYPNRIEDSQID